MLHRIAGKAEFPQIPEFLPYMLRRSYLLIPCMMPSPI
jgi:hypothetical protein